jgi:ribosomal protein S18 acetylase RimI-like enzyme
MIKVLQHASPERAPLDNVIWRALTTRQSHLARVHGGVRKFIEEIGPLAAFDTGVADGYALLAELVGKGGTAGLFSDEPYEDPRQGWSLIAQAPLLRMVRENRDAPLPGAPLAEPLGSESSAEMQALAALTKPGPFGPRTHELGDFFGIRQEGLLVAMAGERMKVPGFTEVSAVCTHPAHAGKGYAGALMGRVVAGIEARGETAFLHVRGDNARAIALYERLGFCRQWSGHFAALRRE